MERKVVDHEGRFEDEDTGAAHLLYVPVTSGISLRNNNGRHDQTQVSLRPGWVIAWGDPFHDGFAYVTFGFGFCIAFVSQ